MPRKGSKKLEANLDGLGKLWEQDPAVRSLALHSGSLLQWPTKAQTGVANFQTIAKNSIVIRHVLDCWCPQVSEAKTVPMNDVAEQARQSTSHPALSLSQTALFSHATAGLLFG